MSEYISNLNMPAPDHLSGQEFSVNEDLERQLALFTNTHFFDFDAGQDANLQAPPTFERSTDEDSKPLEFNLPEDFPFPEYNHFPQNPTGFVGDTITPLPHPIQTDVAQAYSSPSAVNSPQSIVSPRTGDKRKSDAQSSAAFEDASRLAADEDKRRRNTAASARFRIKKKQREQALEQSAKQMSDKMSTLEARIQQLETENTWLKNLITEKNEKEKNDDVKELFKRFSKEAVTKESSDGKEGVGTAEKSA